MLEDFGLVSIAAPMIAQVERLHSTYFVDFHRFQVSKIFCAAMGAPTSSLAEWGVLAEEDLGVPALDQGQSSARWHRPALTGF
jgi:hypothetical protein